jgi:Zn-dependent protease with chaperone function
MKRLIIALLISIPFILHAQHEINLSAQALKKIRTVNNVEIAEGQIFRIVRMTGASSEYSQFVIEIDGEEHHLYGDDIKRFRYVVVDGAGLEEFWRVQLINEGVKDDLIKIGLQLDLRAEIESDALDFVAFAENNNSFFNDSYLESYIYSLVYRLFPGDLPDGRPGVLNVKVLIDIAPNAFMFPNGTLILTTGMLSTINSEEELLAVLAHEISHFVLDHSIDNINTAISRQKRAEFWAGVATVAAASAEIYAGTQGAYIDGSLTRSTAYLALDIAYEITDRMGLKYSREQEMIADRCAKDILAFIGKDPSAMATVLDKLKRRSLDLGDLSVLDGKGTHPEIDQRIQAIGVVKVYEDVNYDRTISFVNTLNAENEFRRKKMNLAFELAGRNIKAGVATEEDYLVQSKVLVYLYDKEEKNQEALDLIQQARRLNVYPRLELIKHEAIVHLRLDDKAMAKTNLEAYLQGIEEQLAEMKNTHESYRQSYYNMLLEEEEWTIKMKHKLALLP